MVASSALRLRRPVGFAQPVASAYRSRCRVMQPSCRTFGSVAKEVFVKKLAEKHAAPMHPRIANAPPEMSVLIPLLEMKSSPSVLFTKRSIHLKSHRGEVCFPGGRMEEGETIEEAALRETQEEIGVDPKSVDVWGRLRPVLTRGLTTAVVPIVGCLERESLRRDCVNVSEVQTLFSVTLEELCRSNAYTKFLTKTAEYTLPVFFSREFKVITHNSDEFLPREFRIWGLSAIMLHQLLLILAPEKYSNPLNLPFY